MGLRRVGGPGGVGLRRMGRPGGVRLRRVRGVGRVRFRRLGGPGGVRVRRIRGAGRVRLGWAGLRLGAALAGHVVPGAHGGGARGGGAAGRAGREGAGARRAVVFERTRYPPDAKGVRRPAVARLRPVPGPLGLLPHGREVVRRDARHLGEGHDGLARGELPPVEVLLPGCRAAPRAGGQGVGGQPAPADESAQSAGELPDLRIEFFGQSVPTRHGLLPFPLRVPRGVLACTAPWPASGPCSPARPPQGRPGPAAGRPRACVEPDVRS